MKHIVHILRHGMTLCGLKGYPEGWPEGHLWVDDHDAEEATCKECNERRSHEDRDDGNGTGPVE